MRKELSDVVRLVDLQQAGSHRGAQRHYEQVVEALAAADPARLGALIGRRVPLSSWQHGFTGGPGDVKVVVDLTK